MLWIYFLHGKWVEMIYAKFPRWRSNYIPDIELTKLCLAICYALKLFMLGKIVCFKQNSSGPINWWHALAYSLTLSKRAWICRLSLINVQNHRCSMARIKVHSPWMSNKSLSKLVAQFLSFWMTQSSSRLMSFIRCVCVCIDNSTLFPPAPKWIVHKNTTTLYGLHWSEKRKITSPHRLQLFCGRILYIYQIYTRCVWKCHTALQ